MIKNINYFLIFLFLYGCGYAPIYKVDQKLNFGLDTIVYSGEKKIGRQIEKNLEKYRNSEASNVFDAVFITSKRQEIASKDKKGDPSSFKLIIELKLDLENKTNDKNFEKKFMRETTFESMDNKFELDQYISNVEKNMIFKILQDMNIFFNMVGNDL